jgi:hypothetical protein
VTLGISNGVIKPTTKEVADMRLKDHRYKGYSIYPSTYLDSKRWCVQTYHQTGVAWGEQDCPQANTLQEAKEIIDDLAVGEELVEAEIWEELTHNRS